MGLVENVAAVSWLMKERFGTISESFVLIKFTIEMFRPLLSKRFPRFTELH